jgi:hypothetical protein
VWGSLWKIRKVMLAKYFMTSGEVANADCEALVYKLLVLTVYIVPRVQARSLWPKLLPLSHSSPMVLSLTQHGHITPVFDSLGHFAKRSCAMDVGDRLWRTMI